MQRIVSAQSAKKRINNTLHRVRRGVERGGRMNRGVVLKMVRSNAAWRTNAISRFKRLARARIIFVNPVIKKKNSAARRGDREKRRYRGKSYVGHPTKSRQSQIGSQNGSNSHGTTGTSHADTSPTYSRSPNQMPVISSMKIAQLTFAT